MPEADRLRLMKGANQTGILRDRQKPLPVSSENEAPISVSGPGAPGPRLTDRATVLCMYVRSSV